jgi:hypothetical protein
VTSSFVAVSRVRKIFFSYPDIVFIPDGETEKKARELNIILIVIFREDPDLSGGCDD